MQTVVTPQYKRVSVLNYFNGKRNGYQFLWIDGKKIIQHNYKEGIECGDWITWYKNGNIRTKGNYDFIIPQNEQYLKEYRCCICLDDYGEEVENCDVNNCGVFMSAEDTCFYVKPKHGKWFYYNTKGELDRVVDYNMGKLEK